MKIYLSGIMFILLTLSACERLANVGQPPQMSMISNQDSYVSQERAAIAVPPPTMPRRAYSQGSLWNAGPTSLFGDRRAQHLGDIMTVVIEIDDKAQISNRSGRSRSGSEVASIGALMGIPSVVEGFLPAGTNLDPAADFSSTSSFAGDGTVARNEKITLRVAATVVDVLENGHLVVRGLQEVRVNFELRELQIAGIVRPEDISRRNEITYDKIAGARISYGGRGQITDVQQPRYGQQIFEIISPL
ncbi:MAG: flagellar basal body L-ring protein FlgH [Paracoccaceae bacterium]